MKINFLEEALCRLDFKDPITMVSFWKNVLSVDVVYPRQLPRSSGGDLFRLLANCFLLFCSDLAVLIFPTVLLISKDLIKSQHCVHGVKTYSYLTPPSHSIVLLLMFLVLFHFLSALLLHCLSLKFLYVIYSYHLNIIIT